MAIYPILQPNQIPRVSNIHDSMEIEASLQWCYCQSLVSWVFPCLAASAAARASWRASWRDLLARFIRYLLPISASAKSAWHSVSISTKAKVVLVGTIQVTPRAPPYLRKARSNSARRTSTSASVEILGRLLMNNFLCTKKRCTWWEPTQCIQSDYSGFHHTYRVNGIEAIDSSNGRQISFGHNRLVPPPCLVHNPILRTWNGDNVFVNNHSVTEVWYLLGYLLP